MKNYKKICALLLAAAMAAGAVTGCGGNKQSSSEGSASTESRESGKTLLKVGLNDACDTLAPWGPNKITKCVVDSSIFQTLAQTDTANGDEEMTGVIAKSWEQTDPVTYEIEIYDYVVDTNGNPLTASDVKFSLEKYSSLNTNYIDSIEVKDDSHLTLVLNTEAPGTFEYLMQLVFMVTEESYNASGDEMATKPVGTTQYKLSEFVANSRIVLEKTDSYWQTEDLNMDLYGANADYIQYDILSESTQMGLALKQDNVVIGRDIDLASLPELEADGLSTYLIDDMYSRGVMFCMLEDSPFYDNLALRQAVCYAIDKEAVCEAVTSGYGEVSKAMYGKEAQHGFNTAWEDDPYAYDVEKAKACLEESGYKSGELTITALSNENADVKTMWEIIQANLSDIGINLEINFASGASYGAYRDATSGQYDIAYYGMDYGDYVTSSWSTLYDDRIRESGLTWFGLNDDYVREMIRTLTTQEGYTEENIEAFYEYTEKNCFYMQLYYQPSALVYNEEYVTDIEKAQNVRGYTFVNALTLSEDWDTYYTE